MRTKEAVTIIIPAVNEEKTIGKIVTDCFTFSPLKTTVLVVIDSKTNDATGQIAKKLGAKVLNIGKGKGKGYAFRKSIPYIQTEYCIQIDADYQFLPKDLKKMISPLLDGYDLTLGTRYEHGSHVHKNAVTSLKRYGSYFLSFATTLASKKRVTDVMAGYKGFKTDSLKKLKIKTDHFGYEAELVILASKKGMRIKNVPISYKKRLAGDSNVDSFRHGFLVLETIISTATS